MVVDFNENKVMCYDRIQFDREQIPQNELNIDHKVRSNLFAWNGQFSPQFIEALISKYAKENDVILDPFVGSGTVLYEAGLSKLEAIGVEINPSAYMISKTYHWINIEHDERKTTLKQLNDVLLQSITNISISEENIHNTLRSIMNELEEGLLKELLKTLIVLLDFKNKKLNYSILFTKWYQLREIINTLPYSDKPIKVFNADAKNIPLPSNSIDLVITSPPYINVYNYHQQYRGSTEFLGWDVLQAAQSEIGSNRKHRSNRFLTVIQYCLDIALILKELIRVCKKDGRIIFVVGRESNVRKVSFSNSEIVYTIAVECLQLDLKLKQERVFQNRFGQMIYEDILHFNSYGINLEELKKDDELVALAKNVAKSFLEKALLTSSKEVEVDITSALDILETVKPSKIYEQKNVEGG